MSLKDITVDCKLSILESLKKLEKSVEKILIVTDKNGKLLGTVTDGDIRRGILKKVKLADSILSVANIAPLTLKPSDQKESVLNEAKQRTLRRIPILDSHDRVIGVLDTDNSKKTRSSENAVVLMAGGLGKRLGSLTKSIPKPLLAVGDKPILETIIKSFIKHNFSRFYLSVNYKSDLIKNHFGCGADFGADIKYLEEETPLGTAGSLSLIDKKDIQGPFFVMNGDLLTNINFKEMLNYHNDSKASMTMGVRSYEFEVPFGVIESKGGYITSIEEKPKHSFFVNAGIYILNPELLSFIPNNKFFDMPSLVDISLKKELKVSTFPLHEYWLDIGKREQYTQANDEYHKVF